MGGEGAAGGLKCCLDAGGEREEYEADGAWLGREGTGAALQHAQEIQSNSQQTC